MFKVCNRCGNPVIKETDKELMKEYPYYCPECEENMYSFEVHDQPENAEEWKQNVVCYLLMHDYLPLNATWVRENEYVRQAIDEMLISGILRMRNCEGKAVELNCN